ncbi:hypothetical protein [Fimbriiglobus ruber]|nr:hypothetical protein [Fimbriiglobus ruber]
MSEAAETLLALVPGRVGLQLTPGCAPDPITVSCPTRTHHGFTSKALRAQVWDGGTLVWHGDSLHPPLERHVPTDWQPPEGVVLETMYPGYAALANGDQIAAAMDEGRWIAVDVAHLDIQKYHGVLADAVLNRLLAYERVAEVHVSTSQDARDSHAKLTASTWGIEWARSRLATGTPVILECYMHKLTHEERLEQVAWLI